MAVVKNTSLTSPRGRRFESQYPHCGSQTSLIPGQGIRQPVLTPVSTCGARTWQQAKPTHSKIIIRTQLCCGATEPAQPLNHYCACVKPGGPLWRSHSKAGWASGFWTPSLARFQGRPNILCAPVHFYPLLQARLRTCHSETVGLGGWRPRSSAHDQIHTHTCARTHIQTCSHTKKDLEKQVFLQNRL